MARRQGVAGVILTLLILVVSQNATAQPSSSGSTARVASKGTPEPEGFFDEPRAIRRGIALAGKYLGDDDADPDAPESGFYPEMSGMVTGAGWIAIGPGYRQWLFGNRALFEASAAISWRAYKMAQARLEVPELASDRLAVGLQTRWQDLTQLTYFGEGPDSLESNRSEYRLQTTNVAGYATVKASDALSLTGRVGWLSEPTLGPPAGAFLRGNPHTRDVFPNDPVYQRGEQPNFVYGEASLAADTRDHSGHPTRGGLYRASAARYSDRDGGMFSFNRFEAEAVHFVPLAERNVVLALHGWVVASGVSDGHDIPFYLQPALGGANTLRSYSNYRFHGHHLAVINVESRFAIFSHVDAAVFFDAGNVARRFGDLDLDRTSYGVGVRVHARGSTLARLDVAHGAEGWGVLFRVNDPFRFGRLSRRTAPIPFAP